MLLFLVWFLGKKFFWCCCLPRARACVCVAWKSASWLNGLSLCLIYCYSKNTQYSLPVAKSAWCGCWSNTHTSTECTAKAQLRVRQCNCRRKTSVLAFAALRADLRCVEIVRSNVLFVEQVVPPTSTSPKDAENVGGDERPRATRVSTSCRCPALRMTLLMEHLLLKITWWDTVPLSYCDGGQQLRRTDLTQVLSRDSLSSIAAKYNCTPSELCALNRLYSRVLFEGMILKVGAQLLRWLYCIHWHAINLFALRMRTFYRPSQTFVPPQINLYVSTRPFVDAQTRGGNSGLFNGMDVFLTRGRVFVFRCRTARRPMRGLARKRMWASGKLQVQWNALTLKRMSVVK